MTSDNHLRRLPGIDKVISSSQVSSLKGQYSHETIVAAARQEIERLRSALKDGHDVPAFEEVVGAITERIVSLGIISPHPLINATGVIIHTNLGRAPLSAESIAAMNAASLGFSNLEIDLESGKRGSRNIHVDHLLCLLTGAEDALVVNNNASAVLLALTALAKRKEVIVSRGHAVEIGGKFRIPDVMRQSGAKLVEVGTTNKTYVSDYSEAITSRTAALLRVHSSNFKLVGFSEEVGILELGELGKRTDIAVLDDLGSGCLLDTTAFGLAPEPRVQDSIAAGAALAMFSGDKLLGGPQAGIIVGRGDLISKLKKHPLARAVRVDKTRLAALSATLIHYLKGEAIVKVPVWRMIAMTVPEIETRANEWVGEIGYDARIIDGESTVGGGSLPGGTLPTKLVTIQPKGKVQDFALRLRKQPVPVIGRLEKNTIALDPRTVMPEQDSILIEALSRSLSEAGRK